MLIALVFALSLLVAPVQAKNPDLASGVDIIRNSQAASLDPASRYVVKVQELSANVFAPEIRRAHGSGFIVELNSDRGVIFTNNHVVAKTPLDAQKIMVQFNTPGGPPETIPVKVAYRSPTLDFAVLEFDPRLLVRAGKSLAVAPLPAGPEELAKVAAQGAAVKAYGSPHDGENIFTDGSVSAWTKKRQGLYIQTTAPINPGNSGGPLINTETGKVIGMNTMKMTRLENTAFAIPISSMMEAYRAWRADPSLKQPRGILVRTLRHGSEEILREGLKSLVEKQAPDFFSQYKGMFLVTEAAPETGMQIGDLLFKWNDQIVGDESYVLDYLVLHSDTLAKATVIRAGKLLELSVPVHNLGMARLRNEFDFIMLSGAVVQELPPDVEWGIAGNKSKLFVAQIVPNTPAASIEHQLPSGSLITEVLIGGEVYPVTTLRELRDRLANRKPGQLIKLAYYPPVLTEANQAPVEDAAYPMGQLQNHRFVASVPSGYILTRRELRLNQMKKKFDFGLANQNRWDWRAWVVKPTCADDLTEQVADN